MNQIRPQWWNDLHHSAEENFRQKMVRSCKWMKYLKSTYTPRIIQGDFVQNMVPIQGKKVEQGIVRVQVEPPIAVRLDATLDNFHVTWTPCLRSANLAQVEKLVGKYPWKQTRWTNPHCENRNRVAICSLMVEAQRTTTHRESSVKDQIRSSRWKRTSATLMNEFWENRERKYSKRN